MIFEEGKDPYVKVDFDGELSHEGMGRWKQLENDEILQNLITTIWRIQIY